MTMFGKTKSIFAKVEALKEMIISKIGDISGDDMLTMTCHLDHHWYDRRKEPLTEKEMQIYDILNKEGLNPSTVYSWFLATKAPADVRVRYRNGKISPKELVRLGRNEVEREKCKVALKLMDDIRELVGVILK